MKETTGMTMNIEEFRQKWPRYRELEGLFLADHLRDYARPENQTRYSENTALINENFKGEGLISKINQIEDSGLPPGGDCYLVQRGFFIFVMRMTGDEMKLAGLTTLMR